MAKNAVFRESEHLSLPVPTGTRAGSPVRVGAVNAVTVTDEGSMSATVGPITFPSGGVGNKPGFASVSLEGGWNVPVNGVCTVGGLVYITVAAALGVPVVTLGATSGTGGTFAAASYFWKVTAINAAGETIGSNEVTAAIATNGTQVLNWSAITGATGYKVYRGTAAGAENTLVTTIGSGATVTYTDTGSAGTAATVPTADTTGPNQLTTSSTGNKFFGYSFRAKGSGLGTVLVKVHNNGLDATLA